MIGTDLSQRILDMGILKIETLDIMADLSLRILNIGVLIVRLEICPCARNWKLGYANVWVLLKAVGLTKSNDIPCEVDLSLHLSMQLLRLGPRSLGVCLRMNFLVSVLHFDGSYNTC